MRVWLDADREPDVSWVWARTAHTAVTLLRGGNVERISFAPDQQKMVDVVLDWMIDNDSPAGRAVHKHDDGVRFPRGLVWVKYSEPKS